ncbi:hypothetical protein KAU92_05590 [Candidatus Bathyarchaeota archaeon]|nr:hypothetical protein [Candidatus Bathyarchaeota archaeon]
MGMYRYLTIFTLGSICFLFSFLYPYPRPDERAFYVGVVEAVFLIASTVLLCGLFGPSSFKKLRKAKDDGKKALGDMSILLITGMSSVLFLTAYSILFPQNLRYFKFIDVYIWETTSHVFFLDSGPVMLFLFTLGSAVFFLSSNFIAATSRCRHKEAEWVNGRVMRDFGLVLAACGIVLPISTAVFSPLIFFGYVPPAPIGVWIFPYLSQGIILVLASVLLLATSGFLNGWATIFDNEQDFYRLIAAMILLFLWLVSAILSNSQAFRSLLFIPHILSYASAFIAIEAFWNILVKEKTTRI